jgi:uncharacterized protein YndB with AHSA1/START domain
MDGPADPLSGTHREIGARRIAAGEARTVVLKRRYDAQIEDVWQTCTDPDRLSRWFLAVSGDLRVGGTFSLEGNASGEILRCEPPRLLTVSWVYGDRPVDEVELRLFPAADGGTVFELEHATVTRQVEWGGRMLDVIPGIGAGWEPALYALDLYLRGALPDTVAAQWRGGKPPAEVEDLIDRSGQEWAALVEAADTAPGSETVRRR